MSETWRVIPGYPDYEVSDLGRVRSHRRGPTRILKAAKNVRNGYRYLSVRNDEGIKSVHVHRLVMLAFVGPKPAHLETRHMDGDTENNTLANLEYGTRLQNIADIARHGKRRAPVLRVVDAGELTLEEAAARVGRTAETIRRACVSGLIAAHKTRGRWAVLPEALDAYQPRPVGRPRKAAA